MNGMVIRQGIARTGSLFPWLQDMRERTPLLLISLLRIVHVLHLMGSPGRMPVWKMGQCRIPIEYYYEKGRCLVSKKGVVRWRMG